MVIAVYAPPQQHGGEHQRYIESPQPPMSLSHALILPRPTQARNSGRAEQWIAGCGWVPRRGASCRLLGRGDRGRRSRSRRPESTCHTSHPKPRDEERISRTCWFVPRSLTAILTARLPRPVPMLVTSLMKSPLARTLATDSSASGAERGK